jgi:hypothetical protein
LLHGKRRKVKLWEEPDQKLVTDDVRGGGCSFWAEWHHAAARTPAVLQTTTLLVGKAADCSIGDCIRRK